MRTPVLFVILGILSLGRPAQGQRPGDDVAIRLAHAVVKGQAVTLSVPCDQEPTARFQYSDDKVLNVGTFNKALEYWPFRVRTSGSFLCTTALLGPQSIAFTMVIVLRITRDDFGSWSVRDFTIESRTADAKVPPRESSGAMGSTEAQLKRALRAFMIEQDRFFTDSGRYTGDAMRLHYERIDVPSGTRLAIDTASYLPGYMMTIHAPVQPAPRACWLKVNIALGDSIPDGEPQCGDTLSRQRWIDQFKNRDMMLKGSALESHVIESEVVYAWPTGRRLSAKEPFFRVVRRDSDGSTISTQPLVNSFGDTVGYTALVLNARLTTGRACGEIHADPPTPVVTGRFCDVRASVTSRFQRAAVQARTQLTAAGLSPEKVVEFFEWELRDAVDAMAAYRERHGTYSAEIEKLTFHPTLGTRVQIRLATDLQTNTPEFAVELRNTRFNPPVTCRYSSLPDAGEARGYFQCVVERQP